MAKHAHTEIPEIDPHSPEGVIEMLRNWEQSHLATIDAKQQNVEYGIVSGEMQKIGERCNRRLVQATSGTCGGCHKPLANVRIFNQVSVFNRNTGKFDEMYACSSRCSDKLIDLQHKNAVAQQQES